MNRQELEDWFSRMGDEIAYADTEIWVDGQPLTPERISYVHHERLSHIPRPKTPMEQALDDLFAKACHEMDRPVVEWLESLKKEGKA